MNRLSQLVFATENVFSRQSSVRALCSRGDSSEELRHDRDLRNRKSSVFVS